MGRRLANLVYLVCFAIIPANALLQAQEVADIQADRDALRELAKTYEQTIAKGDPELLKPYLSSDFSGVMITAEEVNSFESLDEYWQKIQALLGNGGTYRVKVNIPQPAQIEGDIAIAHGTTDDVATTSAGKEYAFSSRWTAVCRKERGEWKIVRIHGSMDPISNTFVAAAVKGASYSSAAIAGIICLLIGFALAQIQRRSSDSQAPSPG